MSVRILQGDVREVLATLPDQSVQCVVTSPPYWGLRDYGVPGQLGLEKTPDLYVQSMVAVFREVRRVLRDDGTLWLNLGSSYFGGGNGGGGSFASERPGWSVFGGIGPNPSRHESECRNQGTGTEGMAWLNYTSRLKPKDMVPIPWMVAMALQADGWYLRSDIIWSKSNPMPESVTDRPTKAHEYIFLLSKAPRYYYNHVAIRNPPSEALLKQVADGYSGKDTKDFEASGAQSASGTKARIVENARKKIDKQRGHGRRHDGFNARWGALTRAEQMALGSNKRSVWTISPKPFKGAHFATFPPDLVEPCILAGSKPGDVVLDPFGGSGTTGMVAKQHGRDAILIELNPAYIPLIEQRIA